MNQISAQCIADFYDQYDYFVEKHRALAGPVARIVEGQLGHEEGFPRIAVATVL